MSENGTVIIGGGLTAAKTAETLRTLGYGDPVTVIGQESVRPYERPGLSKDYLMGKTDADSLFVHDAGWYPEHDVDLRLSVTATGLDRSGRTVQLDTGGTVPYEHLVIATGASPRRLSIPGADADGIHYLRRLGDSTALRSAFAKGKRVVLIGAGWIGLEVAAAAKQAGCAVTVLENARLPLQRVLGDTIASRFARLHEANGVDLRTSVRVTSIDVSGDEVRGVVTESGEVPADLVVIGIGVAPNTELAASAGLDVENGIVVDEFLRTSDPHILAAGDVALARNVTLGRSLRVEHWDNAIRQGELAAHSIVGDGRRYDWQPYFFTDQFDLGMEYVGNASGDDDVHVRGDLDAGEYIAFWTRDGRVTAAMNVNIWDVNETLRGVVGRDIPASRLTDESVPLDQLAG